MSSKDKVLEVELAAVDVCATAVVETAAGVVETAAGVVATGVVETTALVVVVFFE